MAKTARTEFSQALRAIATERGLDADVILETIRQAYIAAYKRDAKERGEDTEGFGFEAQIDSASGEAKILRWELPEVPESEEDSVELEEFVPSEEDKKDVTPPGFGRIAAQTAKQVIHQKIREAEKGALMDEYEGRVGQLVSGTVLRFDGANVRVDLGKAEGLMPADERAPSERLNPSQRLTFLLKEINDTPRGKQIVLSRTDSEFVRKVFAREVPEIASGSVEIKSVAREPGVRTKIAVFSEQSGVDPVGSCVGQKGVRVQAVTNELGGERVDIIPWSADEEGFIKATFAPVEIESIKLEEKEDEGKVATIVVPEDQLSLAIGKDGQNVRLASKITGYRIEVEGPEGKVERPSSDEEAPEETEDVKASDDVESNEPVEEVETAEAVENSEEEK